MPPASAHPPCRGPSGASAAEEAGPLGLWALVPSELLSLAGPSVHTTLALCTSVRQSVSRALRSPPPSALHACLTSPKRQPAQPHHATRQQGIAGGRTLSIPIPIAPPYWTLAAGPTKVTPHTQSIIPQMYSVPPVGALHPSVQTTYPLFGGGGCPFPMHPKEKCSWRLPDGCGRLLAACCYRAATGRGGGGGLARFEI